MRRAGVVGWPWGGGSEVPGSGVEPGAVGTEHPDLSVRVDLDAPAAVVDVVVVPVAGAADVLGVGGATVLPGDEVVHPQSEARDLAIGEAAGSIAVAQHVRQHVGRQSAGSAVREGSAPEVEHRRDAGAAHQAPQGVVAEIEAEFGVGLAAGLDQGVDLVTCADQVIEVDVDVDADVAGATNGGAGSEQLPERLGEFLGTGSSFGLVVLGRGRGCVRVGGSSPVGCVGPVGPFGPIGPIGPIGPGPFGINIILGEPLTDNENSKIQILKN